MQAFETRCWSPREKSKARHNHQGILHAFGQWVQARAKLQTQPSAHCPHPEACHGATTEGALGSPMGLPITKLPCASCAECMAPAADFHPCRAIKADPAIERVHHDGLAAHFGHSSAVKQEPAVTIHKERSAPQEQNGPKCRQNLLCRGDLRE